MTSDIAEAKSQMRREAEARRRAAWQALGESAGEWLVENFVRAIPLSQRMVIAAYWPMEAEIDCRPLLARLAEVGHDLALPVVMAPGQPLVFRSWSIGDDLEAGSLGTSTPTSDASEVVPDMILAPLVAFDGACRRLGRGGGYYDRTFAALKQSSRERVVSVGLAFEAQLVDQVPQAPYDQAVDHVITESATAHC